VADHRVVRRLLVTRRGDAASFPINSSLNQAETQTSKAANFLLVSTELDPLLKDTDIHKLSVALDSALDSAGSE
jgi:hypothetical protein